MSHRLIALFLIFLAFTAVCFADETISKPEYSTTQIPKLVYREAFTVAGLEARDTMEQQELQKLWMDFIEVYPKITAALGDVHYGITYFTENYDPDAHTGYAYLAGTEISQEEELPKGVIYHKVPASHYLVFEHRGPLSHLDYSFEYIFYKYLPASKYHALYGNVLEIYDERFSPDSADSVIEIWLPIVSPQEEIAKPETEQNTPAHNE